MKNYKDFEKVSLGSSDIASLTMRFCSSKKAEFGDLKFGQDSSYSAYFVNEEIDIPEHYELVAEGENWLWIYDDTERTFRCSAESIKVYRAREMGCLIYAPNGTLD